MAAKSRGSRSSSGGVATVLDSERTTEDGAHVVDVKADLGGGDNVTLDHFAPPGVDALPLPGDAAAIGDGAGTGNANATGYNDPKNAGRAKPGEVRVYGRDPDGNVVNEVWLQGSGDVVIENAEGGISIAPDGTVTINGVTFSPQGEVKAPLEISAMNSAVPVKLSTHTHPTGTGPSGPPMPGT
jgi:hypothetical protein